MLLKIDPDVVRRCKAFSERFWEANKDYYKGANPISFKANISMDKMCEFAVYDYLERIEGFKCTPPTLQVEEVKYGKYNPSLVFDKGFKVYTKCIDENTAKANGINWNIDRHLPFIKTPKDNEYVALTFLDKETVQIIGIYKANILTELYKETKIEYYKDKYVNLTWTDIKLLPKLEKEKL